MIKHLNSQHEVVVASLTRSDEENKDAKGIAPYCSEFVLVPIGATSALIGMICSLPTPRPSSFGYFWSTQLRDKLEILRADRPFDLVIVHSSSVGPYVDAWQGVPKIIDFCDMDSQKWLVYKDHKPFPLSLGYWLEGLKLEVMERRLSQTFDFATCATAAECDSLCRIDPQSQCDWISNGVDLEYFQPPATAYDPDQICFVGRMDYFPNEQAMVYFAKDVFPLVRDARPAAKLKIVGSTPTRVVQDLARDEGVEVTGAVPDVRPFLASSALSVVPLKIARGTQNKILESMAMGVPVVASSVAARGVDAVAGEHLLSVDGPAATAEVVLGLMQDPQARNRLAKASRDRVESHHSWPAVMAKLDEVIVKTVARANKRPAA